MSNDNLTPGELLARQISGDESITNDDIEKATKDFFESKGINCTVEIGRKSL